MTTPAQIHPTSTVEPHHHAPSAHPSEKVYGILCLIAGVAILPLLVLIPLRQNNAIVAGADSLASISTLLLILLAAFLLIGAVLLFVMGYRMLQANRTHANWYCDALLALFVSAVLCELMLYGVNNPDLYVIGSVLVYLVAFDTYIDPALAKERIRARARKQEHKQEREQWRASHHEQTPQEQIREQTREHAASQAAHTFRELTHGYITLNFFNLFWIFVIASILGLIIETIFHLIFFGAYQDRAGLLWGPFSPIYGFGAVLMTIALNKLHDKNIILIFFVSALIGGAFEYFVSWFLQCAFGIVAWNYTGMWLSIGGRTCGLFMGFWGLLGVVWIKAILPWMEYFIKKIPWSWRYVVTGVCFCLLLVDGAMTLLALDCWYLREAHVAVQGPIEQFFAIHYDDQFMANRFQTMSLNPADATRVNQ